MVLEGCHKPWQDWYAEEKRCENLGKTFKFKDFMKYNEKYGKDPKDTPYTKYMDTNKYYNKYTNLTLGRSAMVGGPMRDWMHMQNTSCWPFKGATVPIVKPWRRKLSSTS
jgi:hypothetical protein